MKNLKNTIFYAVIAASLFLSNAVMACSSCNVRGLYTQKQLDAYFETTWLMGSIPVMILGFIIFVGVKQARLDKAKDQK